MGRASNRKRARRAERTADSATFRIVVCSYPDSSLLPAVELLKAGVVYGDEVLLHSPTVLLLASVGALGSMNTGDLLAFMREVAPALGEVGAGVDTQMKTLEGTFGADGARPLLKLLLEPPPGLTDLLSTVDPAAATQLSEHAQGFQQSRVELARVAEEQLTAAGAQALVPALDAGILRLAPIEQTEDLFDAYISALWSVLRDPHCYPLLDDKIAELVNAAVREGLFAPSEHARLRGRQATAASEFLARLPTFPRAGMDEIVDIRTELERPLVRFRAELAKLATDLGVDAFDPAFEEAAEKAWVANVQPAIVELEELVEEKRLLRQFGQQVPRGGAIGSLGGLLTGLITHAPLLGSAAGVSAAAVAAGGAVVAERRRLDREMRKRPYFFLYQAEELLAA